MATVFSAGGYYKVVLPLPNDSVMSDATFQLDGGISTADDSGVQQKTATVKLYKHSQLVEPGSQATVTSNTQENAHFADSNPPHQTD